MQKTLPNKITIPEVISDFSNYYAKHPSWGALHNVLEDGNVSNNDVQWCKDHAEETGDLEGARLAGILLQMSKTQRAKLSYKIH